jgi:hypothetical protein
MPNNTTPPPMPITADMDEVIRAAIIRIICSIISKYQQGLL